MTEQAARCVLKLNTPVLNALFPEGTEARVELVNAALAEVTRTYVKDMLSQHVQDHLHALTREVKASTDIRSIVQKYFDTSASWNSVTKLKPGTELTKAIATTVESAFSDQFYKAMEDKIDALTKEYTDKLEARVEYAVNKRLDSLTITAIKQRIDTAVNAALATL